MTPDEKGSIAETAIIHAAVKLGIGVLRPINDGLRYDLMFDLHPELLRVQCKWAVRRGDVVVVDCRSCRRTRDGYLRRTYSPDEIDALAAYCADEESCYLLPPDVFSGKVAVQLRLAPTRNNQHLGVNWASEFAFAATLGPLVGR